MNAERLIASLQYVQLRLYGAITALEQEDFPAAGKELEAAGEKLVEVRDGLRPAA